MKCIHLVSISILFTFALFLQLQQVESCNEMVCASVVSKCQLTQSCNCDLENCTCCRDCLNCLDYLYTECCSCVDLCPRPNETRSALSPKSHVEEFEGFPGLFDTLTAEPDDSKWMIFTFPLDLDKLLAGSPSRMNFDDENDQNLDIDHTKKIDHSTSGTINCTVAYINQCVSWNKCRQNCESMGASSYRWFHDGCCECVGSTCINYGINESRCVECSDLSDDNSNMDMDDDEENEDDFDYGDGHGMEL